jgi:hypothetical protein
LLASLPGADLARVMPSLEQVDRPLGQHLHDPGSAQEHFYFPGTSIVSLVGVLSNGREEAGNRGMDLVLPP